jgi:hypothetical protein
MIGLVGISWSREWEEREKVIWGIIKPITCQVCTGGTKTEQPSSLKFILIDHHSSWAHSVVILLHTGKNRRLRTLHSIYFSANTVYASILNSKSISIQSISIYSLDIWQGILTLPRWEAIKLTVWQIALVLRVTAGGWAQWKISQVENLPGQSVFRMVML